MKKGNLKIGVSEPKFFVKVEINESETVEDMMSLAKGSLNYVLSCFMRGHRIALQDSDARSTVAELVQGKTTPELADEKFVERVTKAVEKDIAAFDPTAERKRGGRPAKPVDVEVSKKSYTVAEMQELLKAAGAKVNFVTAK